MFNLLTNIKKKIQSARNISPKFQGFVLTGYYRVWQYNTVQRKDNGINMNIFVPVRFWAVR